MRRDYERVGAGRGRGRVGVKELRIECDLCRRAIATYVPKNGDGTVRLFKPHCIRPGHPCRNSRMPAGTFVYRTT